MMNSAEIVKTFEAYAYSEWILNGLSFTVLCFFALMGLALGGQSILRRWRHVRISKMTPQRYREWQGQVLAKELVNLGDLLIDRQIYTRREFNDLLNMIGHRCLIPDLVPKERVKRISVQALKNLIRGRLKNPPPKKENMSLANQLQDAIHDKINGTPKPGDQ